jgi:hypothetical protein
VREGFAGRTLAGAANDLLAEAVVGLIYAAFGYLLYRSFERYATRSGEYEMS